MSDEDRFRAALLDALDDRAPRPDAGQIEAMYAYYAGVVEANRRFNLTRIVDPAQAAVKHFADSVALLGWVETAAVRVSSVLDVGSGAGFPAAPLAIMRPDWRVTAVDSVAKKARFIAELSVRLKLPNLSAEHRRAGPWRPPAGFDLVTHKAVTGLANVLKQSRSLATAAGFVAVYKTDAVPVEEQREALRAADRHRFDPPEVFRYTLRLADQTLKRALWCFRKR